MKANEEDRVLKTVFFSVYCVGLLILCWRKYVLILLFF